MKLENESLRSNLENYQNELNQLEVRFEKEEDLKIQVEKENEEINQILNEQNNKIDVLEKTIEEKFHIESLYIDLKEDLKNERERFNKENEQLKEELYKKENDIKDLKMVIKNSYFEIEKKEETRQKSESSLNKTKQMLIKEINKHKNEVNMKEILQKENQKQKIKIKEYHQEVNLISLLKFKIV